MNFAGVKSLRLGIAGLGLAAASLITLSCASEPSREHNDASRGLASVGSTTGGAATGGPGDTSIPRDEEFERNFQTVLLKPMPGVAVRESYFENLLGCLYRAEAYIDQFEKELDPLVEKAKADPNFQADMIGTPAYRKIHLMHIVSIDLTNKLSYIYGRLLETQTDATVGPELQAKAAAALTEIDEALANMPVEDRLQLLDLVEGFSEIRKSFKTTKSAAKDAANNQSTGNRNVASIKEPNFAAYNYTDQNKLNADLKKSRNVTRAKAALALQSEYPLIDETVAALPETEREPAQSAGYAPGTGPMGNVIGTHFPLGLWALTLDDGPHPDYTPKYMDALLAHRDKINIKGAPASFMWIEKNVALYPGIVKRAVDSGFSTNCHSWTHMLLNHANHAARVHEVTEAVHAEEKAYGRKMRFYRCPGGNCYAPAIPEVRQMIADLGLLHAYWSLDSLDWKLKDAQRTYVLATKQMTVQKRGVILMHDIHPYSLDAARMLLKWIAAQNNSGADHIRLVTLDDAVDIYNKQAGGAN